VDLDISAIKSNFPELPIALSVGKKDRSLCLNNLPIRGILIAIKKAKKK